MKFSNRKRKFNEDISSMLEIIIIYSFMLIILGALKPDKTLNDNEKNIRITNFKYAAIHDEDISQNKLNITEEKSK